MFGPWYMILDVAQIKNIRFEYFVGLISSTLPCPKIVDEWDRNPFNLDCKSWDILVNSRIGN